jgi:wyosine [tRNA(Phe)-imidazoG37] synthetase (radical SAM superfamily)
MCVMESAVKERVRRAEVVPVDVIRGLRRLVKKEGTMVDAVVVIGITEPTLRKVLKKKKASTPVVRKIREAVERAGCMQEG